MTPLRTSAALLMALASLVPAAAQANDSEYASYSGVPTPIENADVSMKYEEIVFTHSAQGWRVDATYRFKNTLKTKTSLKMGYPEIQGMNEEEHFEGLKTWVRGKPVGIETRTSAQIAKPWEGYELGRVHLFSVDFEPEETLEVKHTFVMKGGSSVAMACEREISYITRTGRLWKGKIGTARFVVNMDHVPDGLSFPPGYTMKSYENVVVKEGVSSGVKIVFEMKDWVPKADFNLILMSTCGSESSLATYYTRSACPLEELYEPVQARLKKTEKLTQAQAQERAAGEAQALKGFSGAQLRLCRNMVYAKYGYSFKDPKLNKVFYSHKPGALAHYPPHMCAGRKDLAQLVEEGVCRKQPVVMYMPRASYTPRLLSKHEAMYVRIILEQEKARAQRARAKGSERE